MPDRFTVALSAAALASLAFVAACSSDATQPDEIANTRFINASSSTSSITATDEGRVVATGLAFQNANQPTNCSTVERGSDVEIKFTLGATTTDLGTVKAPFVAQANYSVVFYGPSNIAVYPDNFSVPPAGQNALRFINATGAAGDVYVTGPNDLITIVGPAISGLASNQVSGFDAGTAPGGTFTNFSNGSTRVRLFNPGQIVNPVADFTITAMPSNNVATVVLTPPPPGGSATGFLVGPCGS